MARTITFQPSAELGAFIESLIESGAYNTQSEVIRDALRLLQEKNAASKLETLRQLIDEGDNSPAIADWNVDTFLQKMKNRPHDDKT